VGAVGVCTSASNTTFLAAQDSRIKAFATVAGFLVNEDVFTATYTHDGIGERLQ
jgi:uncharacterized protein